MSITNPFPPFILHTKFNSLLLCFAPVRANSMRSLSVWEFFLSLSLSASNVDSSFFSIYLRCVSSHFSPVCWFIQSQYIVGWDQRIRMLPHGHSNHAKCIWTTSKNHFHDKLLFSEERAKAWFVWTLFSAHFAANWNLFQGLWQFWVSNSYLYSGKKITPERKQKRLINTAGEIQRMENSMFAQLPIKLLKSNELMKNKRIRNQSIDQKSVMLKLR